MPYRSCTAWICDPLARTGDVPATDRLVPHVSSQRPDQRRSTVPRTSVGFPEAEPPVRSSDTPNSAASPTGPIRTVAVR